MNFIQNLENGKYIFSPVSNTEAFSRKTKAFKLNENKLNVLDHIFIDYKDQNHNLDRIDFVNTRSR